MQREKFQLYEVLFPKLFVATVEIERVIISMVAADKSSDDITTKMERLNSSHREMQRFKDQLTETFPNHHRVASKALSVATQMFHGLDRPVEQTSFHQYWEDIFHRTLELAISLPSMLTTSVERYKAHELIKLKVIKPVVLTHVVTDYRVATESTPLTAESLLQSAEDHRRPHERDNQSHYSHGDRHDHRRSRDRERSHHQRDYTHNVHNVRSPTPPRDNRPKQRTAPSVYSFGPKF